MPSRRNKADKRARQRDLVWRLGLLVAMGDAASSLAELTRSVRKILEPIRAISRVLGSGKSEAERNEDEEDQILAEIDALLEELEPKPPGPRPRWRAQFSRWQEAIEGGKHLSDILREEVPGDDRKRESVRVQFERWEATK